MILLARRRLWKDPRARWTRLRTRRGRRTPTMQLRRSWATSLRTRSKLLTCRISLTTRARRRPSRRRQIVLLASSMTPPTLLSVLFCRLERPLLIPMRKNSIRPFRHPGRNTLLYRRRGPYR
ncbi:hypothetical protein EXIGLDRAFT_338579 [Exidia glandulosa HHB12029]|uniref:Uncharacterized protein n=1 Tax=Exidia glandulosa HHB12029 TaxID=1314781 RepID=A0A165CJY5_EXIGL|nr:hypothetical protein EXIGLDRAFT_338579 [Exidia glandulosa HHB12029]